MNYRIGVDGGGTKTDCILLNDDGSVAACRTAPGCNPSVAGAERARTVLIEALQALVADAPRLPSTGGTPVDRVLLCMAGSQSFWNETAAMIQGYGRIETLPDSLPVLELATDGRPGLVLHAGTGSFVAARAPDGSVHYAGGLGWRFGDPGSGYDVGRRAITLALLELQGWSPRTALADQLCAHTGLTDYPANSRLFYRGDDTNATIAAFAPRVVDLAGQGCPPAQRVIAESIADLWALVDAVCARLFPGSTLPTPVPCGVSGALLNCPPCWSVLRDLAAGHGCPVQLKPVTARPIEGVRRLLRKMA
jgi:N-acetylglucosamine kinase-like BadF-type ATPase